MIENDYLNAQFLDMIAHLKALAGRIMDRRAYAAFERTLSDENSFMLEYFLKSVEKSMERRAMLSENDESDSMQENKTLPT